MILPRKKMASVRRGRNRIPIGRADPGAEHGHQEPEGPASRCCPRPIVGLQILCLLALLTGCGSPLEAVVLRINHRIYSQFDEVRRVSPGERFQIGDTDFTGRIIDFVPDFAINPETKEVFTRTNLPRNPAVKIEVFEGGTKVEEVWAFQGEGAPHFSRESMLRFRIEELVWKAGATVPDSIGPETP